MTALLFAAALLAQAAPAAPAAPQAAAPAAVPFVEGARPKDKIVCEDRDVIGSKLKKRVCMLQSEKETREREVQQRMDDLTRAGPGKQQ